MAQARWVAVSVEVAQRTSNAMEFELVPSGTPRVEQRPLISSPSAVVRVGVDFYVTAQGFANVSGGLYRVELDGRTTRVVRSRFVTQREPAQSRYDTPQFLTTDGTDVWFTTAFGAVRRYHVASGTVSEVTQLTGSVQGITRAQGGSLFITDSGGRVHRISPTGALTRLTAPELDGAYGIVADGTDVFVSNVSDGSVTRIANAEGSYTLTPRFTTSPSAGLSLTLANGGVASVWVPPVSMRSHTT